MTRFRRIAASFAIVVVAYWVYALAVVPWIEPPADLAIGRAVAQTDGTTKDDPPEPPDDPIRPQMDWIKKLFRADAWESKKPTILESNRAKLIFESYRNHPDGRIELHPCTVVFPYDGPAEDEDQRIRQSIVLEAPGGALLQFDPPLDLARPKFGRLVGGRLVGPITIRSDWKLPGPEDDLLIVTRDVELLDQIVHTPHIVDFRWGPHFGRGRDMMITLLKAPMKPGSSVTGPNIAGIGAFEMRHVELLRLDMGQVKSGKAGPRESMPVEIQCRGPFRFDVPKRVASFRDGVNVMKLNATGPADQVLCDVLSVHFVGRKDGVPAGGNKPKPDSLDLVAQRLEARGNPVVVKAPSQNVTAQGPRIEYNLLSQSITLDGAQDVFLQQATNEIHARTLNYQSAGQDRLGRVLAEGPGWLRGKSDRGGQQLEAVWREQLRVAPDGENHVVSLSGGAELRCPGVGQLQANEILLWLNEMPPVAKGASRRLRPDHLAARNAVHMNSPQLSGEVEQLDVRFEEIAPVSGLPRETSDPVLGRVAGGFATSPAQGGGGPGMTNAPPRGMVAVPSAQPGATQRFGVMGRALQAHVLLGGAQPGVARLVIQDGVRFFEEPSGDPNAQRLLQIIGDRLELTDATAPNAVATVVGRPAHCEARGLGLTGATIRVNRGENRLEIDGPGQMDMPLPAAQGQPSPRSLAVTWQRGMLFDGQTATFADSVVAAVSGQPSQQRLQTQTMAVQLSRPVVFSTPSSQQQPEVEKIGCSGGVWIENRTCDQQGQPLSWEQLQVPSMGVNTLSGQVRATGPGWLRSVRRGSTNVLGEPGVAAARSEARDQNQLTCMYVTFQTSITGTLPLQKAGTGGPLLNLIFADHVRGAYAPVDRWDATIPVNNPDKLGPQGMTARCDQLSVAEMPVPGAATRSFELAALGNAVVEGTTFTARANRISYDSAKGMLVLEGGGREYAVLHHQLRAGDEQDKSVARKILYWPKTHGLRVEGGQSLNMGQTPVALPAK
ncbi:MAG: hypothetical protein ABFC63_10565 [Thermoguttaceae bacterium]